ncbi:MAG TPA: hypothetical protein PKW33_16875 [Anaerolineaceae bacterium]|nr:hypothetical protein [Anaerolineaceae bacterium]HPN53273.1 hypothetical protein [Anaerolineaceae bacterium]
MSEAFIVAAAGAEVGPPGGLFKALCAQGMVPLERIEETLWAGSPLAELPLPAALCLRGNASGQQAVHAAAQAISAGDNHLILCGGMGEGLPGADWLPLAASTAARWNLTRAELDEAVLSRGGPWDRDGLAALTPLQGDAPLTRAHFSAPQPGAAAFLLSSTPAVGSLNLIPQARVIGCAAAAPQKDVMGILPAALRAIRQAGLTLAEIELALVNEHSAAFPLTVQRALELPAERINPQPEPLAPADGAVLLLRLLEGLQQRKAVYGLALCSLPDGSGLATVMECL